VDAGTAGKNKVPVRIVVPKDRSNQAKYAAEITAAIITHHEEDFGVDYPYDKADQVSIPELGFAMETLGISSSPRACSGDI
jgi:aminopeptidase N